MAYVDADKLTIQQVQDYFKTGSGTVCSSSDNRKVSKIATVTVPDYTANLFTADKHGAANTYNIAGVVRQVLRSNYKGKLIDLSGLCISIE